MFKGSRMSAGKIKAILILLGIGLIPLALESAYLRNVPVQVRQPDGETIGLFASGDEFYNWIHDANGYTIVRDPETGYFVYAGKKDGALFPSSRKVSSQAEINLQSVMFLSIPQHLTHSPDMRLSPQLLYPQGSPANPEEINNAPRIGTIIQPAGNFNYVLSNSLHYGCFLPGFSSKSLLPGLSRSDQSDWICFR